MRAARFRREIDRRRWVASRLVLRSVLGRYTGLRPEDVGLRAGTLGKPELALGRGGQAPHFNLSHSGPMLVVAVAEQPVGVDVEQTRDLAELEGLIRHVFRAEERTAFETVPRARRTETFLAVWTRKEAYLKARGRGIAALRRIGVTVDPDVAALTRDDDDPDATARFSVLDLDLGTGYRAAIAAVGRPALVVRRIQQLDDRSAQ